MNKVKCILKGKEYSTWDRHTGRLRGKVSEFHPHGSLNYFYRAFLPGFLWPVIFICLVNSAYLVYLNTLLCVHTYCLAKMWKCELLSCVWLCDLDCSQWGSSVHGIFQAKILEWVAILFSRESSQHRDQTQFSYISDGFFSIWTTRKAQDWVLAKMDSTKKAHG